MVNLYQSQCMAIKKQEIYVATIKTVTQKGKMEKFKDSAELCIINCNRNFMICN